MVDHHRRVKNAIHLAREIYSKKLLQDIYPTHYLPNVGRQVMNGGGVPEDMPQYDAMGNVTVPPAKKEPDDQTYRQPFGERVSEGISHGFGTHRLGMSEENASKYDPTGILQTFAAPADLALRAPGAIVGGLSAAGAGLYGMLPGVQEADVNRMQRDLRVLGDVGMIEAGSVRPKVPSYTEPNAPRAPVEPTPSAQFSLSELRQAQETAKQAFDEAVQAIRSDRNNPELKAQVAQRKQEMMTATRELEKAESSLKPKPKEGSNVPLKPTEPSYVPPVSNMGLYSYAAEVAARAKQAGKPEDLIAWVKAQPGVKFEELRDAGALNRDGSYNPNFAPNIKNITPQELADLLHSSIPEVVEYVRPEFETVKVSDPVDLINTAEKNPAVWDKVFSDTYGDWLSHHPESIRQMLEEPMAQRIAERYFNENNGVVKTKGEAKYSPSKEPELTTTGGDNYREIALSLTPYEENPKMYYKVMGPVGSDVLFETKEQASQHLEAMKAKAAEILKDDPSQLDVINRNIARSGVIEVDDPNFQRKNIMNYGHMSEVPNNLAWLRVQDVSHPSGEGKSLRVEETQSDISQKGRERGFRMNESELAAAKEALNRDTESLKKRSDALAVKFNEFTGGDTKGYSEKWDQFLADPAIRKEYYALRDVEDAIRSQKDAINRNNDRLPRLPYMEDTKQWTDLTTKRALVEAVKGGYDSLQFIKGDINRERYLGYEEGDAGYHYDVNIPSSLKRVLKSIDPDAKIETITQRANENDPRYVALKGHYERDIRLSEEAINDVRKNLREEPLEENRRDLEYELQDLQNELDDLHARLNVLTSPKQFWSVEMTPKIREAVQKGLPRYQDGGSVYGDPIKGEVLSDDDAPQPSWFVRKAGDDDIVRAAKEVGIYQEYESPHQYLTESVYGEDAKKVADELRKKGFDGVIATDIPIEGGGDTIKSYMPLSEASKEGKKRGGAVSYNLRDRDDWSEATRYEDTGGKLKWEHPDDYLRRTRPLEMNHHDKKSIHHFEKKMKHGEDLNPVAIYKEGRANGRHRANAAKNLGVDKIPVVTWPGKSEGGYIREFTVDELKKALEG